LGGLWGFQSRARAGGPAPPALAFLFWGALGAGVLIKGPVLPGIAALTLAALWIADRRAGVCSGLFRALRPVAGAPLFLAIAAPWFIAIAVSDGGFIADAVRGDLLPKLLGGHESHGAPPGFYLATSPLAFWPGVFLVPFGLIWAWRNRAEPGLRFCLAWLIPAWIALELVPTKLVHYTLPLYPAAALMAGQAVTRGHDWLAGALARWPARLWLAVWGLAGAAVCALIPVLGHFTGGGAGLAGWAAAGAAAAALAGGLAGALARRPLLAAALPLPGMVLFIGLAFQAALPGLTQLWPSAAAAGLVAAHPPPPGTAVAAAGYHEPSLVFALGTATALTSPEGAAGRLAARPGALALIESRAEDKFLESSKRIGQRPMKLGSVGGFNLSKGRFVTLTLYRGEPAQP
jgi:4-amino-4-deoxy-L-arabinose transferase-like glycosyltransferase